MQRVLSRAAVLLLLVGCQMPGGARYLAKQTDGGVIAIPRDTPGERDKAFNLIAKHVGPNFVIDKEEDISFEDRTSRTSRSSTDAVNPRHPLDVFAVNSRPASEHRIYYHRTPAVLRAPTELPTEVISKAPASGVVQASATVPATPMPLPEPLPLKEGMLTSSGSRSFLPLTCEGCQGR